MHAAINKDSRFAARVKNIVALGGTYLSQGNTDYFSSEYNFFKDPLAAASVFDSFSDITLVPLETTFFQRGLHVEHSMKPYMQTHTKKGKLVHESYRVAFKNLQNHYETCDPFAVAVAIIPDLSVEEAMQKCCYIETEGEITSGTVVIDWFERYPALPRPAVKIITKLNGMLMIDLLTESVSI